MKFFHWMSLCTTLAIGAALIVLVIQGREAQAQRNAGLRTFICYFDHAVLKQHQTPAQRHTAIVFFNNVTAKLNEPPCSQQ